MCYKKSKRKNAIFVDFHRYYRRYANELWNTSAIHKTIKKVRKNYGFKIKIRGANCYHGSELDKLISTQVKNGAYGGFFKAYLLQK